MAHDFKKEMWKVVDTVRVASQCRYKKSPYKCTHEENAKKKCSFENCPIAPEKICLKNKCMFGNWPFKDIMKVVVKK